MKVHQRTVSLLLLFTLFGLPGMSATLDSAAQKCAMACGRKCCCRPAGESGRCAMRASCCPVQPSDTAAPSMTKGQPTQRARLPVPVDVPAPATARVAIVLLRDLPSPPDPPPRAAS
jgi:hypothetical protein